MKVKAIEFGGFCPCCRQGNDTPTAWRSTGRTWVRSTCRPGVEIILERGEDMGEMICAACANRLQAKISVAVLDALNKAARGYEYKNDRWHKTNRKRST